MHGVKFGTHTRHILRYGLVEHPCIYLRCGNVGVSKHFGNALYGNMIIQRHRGEGMSRDMCRQVLADFCKRGNFGKIRVHSLVGYYRKHQIFGDGFGVVAVFLRNTFGDFKQRYGADLSSLLTGFAYPFLDRKSVV